MTVFPAYRYYITTVPTASLHESQLIYMYCECYDKYFTNVNMVHMTSTDVDESVRLSAILSAKS